MSHVDVDMGVNRQAIGYDEQPRPARAHEPPELAGRDLEVLQLVAAGMTSAAMARALGVSRATVTASLGRIRRCLGARSTAQALLLAERAGLLDEDGCE